MSIVGGLRNHCSRRIQTCKRAARSIGLQPRWRSGASKTRSASSSRRSFPGSCLPFRRRHLARQTIREWPRRRDSGYCRRVDGGSRRFGEAPNEFTGATSENGKCDQAGNRSRRPTSDYFYPWRHPERPTDLVACTTKALFRCQLARAVYVRWRTERDQFCHDKKIDDSDGAFSIEKLSFSTKATLPTK